MLDIHAVSLQIVACFDSLSDLLVLVFEFLSLFDQSLDVLFGKSAFVVGDSDLGIF